MLDIEERHLHIIGSVLSAYDCAFFMFGSRATGKAKPFSDADILFFEDLPEAAQELMAEAFEESDLPYKVDLVDYHRIDADFRRLIADTYVCIQPSTSLLAAEETYSRHYAAGQDTQTSGDDPVERRVPLSAVNPLLHETLLSQGFHVRPTLHILQCHDRPGIAAKTVYTHEWDRLEAYLHESYRKSGEIRVYSKHLKPRIR